MSLCPQRPSRKVKFAAVESSEPSASCRDSNTDSTDWETSWNTNTTVCLQSDHLSCPIIKGSEHDHVSASLHKLCVVTLFHTKADSFKRFYKSPFLYLHILPTTLPQRVSDGTCRWRCAPNRFINVLWASLKSKCLDGTKYEKPCSWWEFPALVSSMRWFYVSCRCDTHAAASGQEEKHAARLIGHLIESNAEHRWSKCLCTLAQHFKCGKRAADTGRFLSSTSSTKSQNGAKEGAKDGENTLGQISYVRAQQVDIWVSLVNISLINIAAFTVSWSAFWQAKEQSHNLSQSCTKDTS